MSDKKEVLTSLEDLGDAAKVKAAKAAQAPEKAVEAAPVKPAEPKLDDLGRAYATGRRKDAVARVWIKPGKGKTVVNGRDIEKYFARAVLRLIINQPFDVTKRVGSYDIMATVKGGGLSGQAGAVRHALARALCNAEPQLRPALKAEGLLTRDARTVERKKYGRHKARKKPQFSKR